MPARNNFYSSIKDGEIGDDCKISDGHIRVKDYLTCEKIWDKFDVKINVIPNGLEKHMTFCLNKNLVFIETMHVMNSGLDKLVKNVSDKDFKYLVEKFGSENLELLKQKGDYLYECMNSFERFNE